MAYIKIPKNRKITIKTEPKAKAKKRTFSSKDYMSGDGMLTSVWVPAAWHLLHTISFNYPITPTEEQKKYYKEFIESMTNVLPCKYCRMNLENKRNTLFVIRSCIEYIRTCL